MPVRIYTTPNCQYCEMVKKFFAKHNVRYEDIDVSEDARAREEMVKKSHQLGVPVIEVDNHVFVGFDRVELSKALHIQ